MDHTGKGAILVCTISRVIPVTNNGLLVISGQAGSGKSQLALDLLAQLTGYGVRFVFFDMKGELEDAPNDL